MKTKIILSAILLMTASISNAQLSLVPKVNAPIAPIVPANQSFGSSQAFNAALNGASNAFQRTASTTGQAATSAAATAVRSNLARSAIAGGTAGIAGGVVGIVAGVAVGLLLDWGAGKLSSNADSSLNLTNKKALNSLAGAFNPGDSVWTLKNAPGFTNKAESTSVTSLLPLWISSQNSSGVTDPSFVVVDAVNCRETSTQYYCKKKFKDGHISTSETYTAQKAPAKSSCGTGFVFNASACVPDPSATIGEQTNIVQIGDLLTKLSEADKQAKVSPTDLSNLTNAWLSALNQAGYQNAPMTNPSDFANADVSVEQALSPITKAQLEAATTPIPTTATNATATTAPTTTTNPDGSTTVNVNAKVDLGTDPGIVAPGLEATPTTNQILDPIFNMMPKKFTISGPQGSCPNPTVILLGHSYNFDLMCNILNTNASIISAIMLFAFAIAALRIVLSA